MTDRLCLPRPDFSRPPLPGARTSVPVRKAIGHAPASAIAATQCAHDRERGLQSAAFRIPHALDPARQTPDQAFLTPSSVRVFPPTAFLDSRSRDIPVPAAYQGLPLLPVLPSIDNAMQPPVRRRLIVQLIDGAIARG